MISIGDRPYRYPWVRAAPDSQAYAFEYGGQVVKVTGAYAVPLLSALLPRLDGRRTVGEICRLLDTWDPQAITQALSVLLSNGLIGTAEIPSGGEDERLLFALLGPPDQDHRLHTACLGVAGEGPLAETVRRLCEESGMRRPRAVAWDAEPPDGCALIIAAPDSLDLPRLRAWNRRMLARRQEWLPVLPFDGHVAAVGPLCIPGETGCYLCLRIRRRSVLDDPELATVYEDRPADRPVGAAVRWILAGLAVHLAGRWLLYRDARIAGILYTVSLTPQPGVSAHEVLPVPRCPACRAPDLRTPSPWYPVEVHGSEPRT